MILKETHIMTLKNFIVFEGIDGSGTSTQLNILQKKLADKKVFITAEPTTNETGKFLRRVLSGEIPVQPTTAAYLFAADRNEHIYGKDGILQHINNGSICISDRYLFSSLAYQSAECGKELPEMLNSIFPLPEVLFYFSIDPAISLNRIIGRGVTEIYEKEDFLTKTASEYEKVIDMFKTNEKLKNNMKIIEIDAIQPIEKVSKIIWDIVSKMPILDM